MTSTNNTTENGFWEREKQVCEGSQSFSSIDPDASGVLNAADYLPQFVARRFGEVVPILADSCRLKVRFHPNKESLFYTYSVSWFEDGPVHEEIKQLKLKKSNKKKQKKLETKKAKIGKSVHCCQGDAAKLPVLNFVKKKNSQEVSVELVHETSNPEVRLCDGPCGQMRAIHDLRILGRCDHAICSLCVVNAPMLPQDDGSMGCCNKRCFATDLVNRIPNKNRRHELYQLIFKNKPLDPIFEFYNDDVRRINFPRNDATLSKSEIVSSISQPISSVSSSASMNSAIFDGSLATTSSSSTYELSIAAFERIQGAAEVVLFRLIALENKYFSTIRCHRYEVELPSNMTLMTAFEQVLGSQSSRNVHKIKTTRIFYFPEGNLFKMEKVLELDPQKHGSLSLIKFWKKWIPICIIVDFTGKVIKEKKPLFIPGKN